ncbi:hypothetical protein L596_020161 [Steinernema carpocapsae]|uniref:Uncharacterized protein n=1 Tax=Steinernema carpocapsae TaxID=34508 RepID=A0A4V6A0U2_STECR|nr:hypothetical protein L596_020161 [Steinernema carpocapsae]
MSKRKSKDARPCLGLPAGKVMDRCSVTSDPMVFQIPTHPSQQSHVAQLGFDVLKRCAKRRNRLSIMVEDKQSNELKHLFKIALDAFKQDKIKYLKFFCFSECFVESPTRGFLRTQEKILTCQQLEELILWFSKSAKFGRYELVVTEKSEEEILNVFKRLTEERKPDNVNWPKFAENSNCGKRKDKTVFTAQLQNRTLEITLKNFLFFN